MNLVAHQLLSFNIPDLQVGNALAEFVRGKDYQDYPKNIATGILLHRNIDSFTDFHPIVKQTTTIFHEHYKKFAPIITDVIYDYYLIKNWHLYCNESFEDFKQKCYELMNSKMLLFPSKMQFFMKMLIKEDWFERYTTYEGIEFTLYKLSQKSKFTSNMNNSLKEIYIQDKNIEQQFLTFYPQLMNFCKSFINKQLPELHL